MGHSDFKTFSIVLHCFSASHLIGHLSTKYAHTVEFS